MTRSNDAAAPTDEERRMLARYEQRKKENEGKEINNASLPAGSPMYFYCNACSAHVATLPENYVTPPPRHCAACKELVRLGLI